MAIRVGIYLYDNVEVLDFAGPYEVFTTAARVHHKNYASASDIFEVITIGKTSDSVRARAGLSVYPDYTILNHPTLDVLLIPGGVVNEELELVELISWIQTTSKQTKLTASICTGAFLLAKAGLLDGKKATTHWEDIEDLKSLFPKVTVVDKKRWVDEDTIVTSGGISAGIDMSLHLISRLVDNTLATQTAKQLEFDWTKNNE